MVPMEQEGEAVFPVKGCGAQVGGGNVEQDAREALRFQQGDETDAF